MRWLQQIAALGTMLLFCFGPSPAAECASCHVEQARRHAASMHERALRPASKSRVPGLFDRPVRERDGTELDYRRKASEWFVTSTVNGRSATAPLTWIFGAGTLAFTPVGEADGQYFEHRVTWYSNLHRPGMTMGHPVAKPASAKAALGTPQRAETITRCFHCHATNVQPGPDLSSMIPGIQCERCHGSGTAHAASPSRGNIVRNATVEACAECHRMPPGPPGTVPPEVSDPMSIRFAPVGLMASRCYVKGGVLCVTCHDPHSGKTSAEAACASCHTSLKENHAKSGCVGCHMPKSEVLPGMTFTDHRIR